MALILVGYPPPLKKNVSQSGIPPPHTHPPLSIWRRGGEGREWKSGMTASSAKGQLAQVPPQARTSALNSLATPPSPAHTHAHSPPIHTISQIGRGGKEKLTIFFCGAARRKRKSRKDVNTTELEMGAGPDRTGPDRIRPARFLRPTGPKK